MKQETAKRHTARETETDDRQAGQQTDIQTARQAEPQPGTEPATGRKDETETALISWLPTSLTAVISPCRWRHRVDTGGRRETTRRADKRRGPSERLEMVTVGRPLTRQTRRQPLDTPPPHPDPSAQTERTSKGPSLACPQQTQTARATNGSSRPLVLLTSGGKKKKGLHKVTQDCDPFNPTPTPLVPPTPRNKR